MSIPKTNHFGERRFLECITPDAIATLAEFAGVVSTNSRSNLNALPRPKGVVPTRTGRRPLTPHNRECRQPKTTACYSKNRYVGRYRFLFLPPIDVQIDSATRPVRRHVQSPVHTATLPYARTRFSDAFTIRCAEHSRRRTVEGDRCHKGGGDQPVMRDRPAVDSSPAEQFLHLAARRFTK